MTKDVIKRREKEGISTGDFIDRLRELCNEIRSSPDGGKQLHGVNEDMVIGNSALFLLAGFATTAHTLTALSSLLAQHPDIQQQVHEEMMENLDSRDGDDIGYIVTYESVQKLKFLDAAIDETLRLYSPVPRNTRRCTKDVEVNGIMQR